MKPWLTLLACGLVVIGAGQSPRKRPKTEKQLKASLSQLRNQKQALRAELKSTKRRANFVIADLQRVNERLNDVESALIETQSDLDAGKRSQDSLKVQLEKSTKRLAAVRQQVGKRLARMYMQPGGAFLSALVGTSSVGELASRKALMESIQKQDRELFTECQELQKRVASEKAEQDATVRRMARLMDRQKQQQESLKSTKAEKGEVLSDLRERQGELQKAIRQFEADEQEIAAQIAAFMRRVPKKGEAAPPQFFRGGFRRPVSAPITSGFGMRYHPLLHINRMHKGIDFGVPIGTPVHAAADGVVVACTRMSGFGNVVILNHGGGMSTVYGHLSRFMCAEGQRVRQGQTIAASGSTGMSTGPHLHFEIHVNGTAVNPRSKM